MALLRSCGPARTGRFGLLTGTATIIGVALLDVIHGQRGVAPNAIELHPVPLPGGSFGPRPTVGFRPNAREGFEVRCEPWNVPVCGRIEMVSANGWRGRRCTGRCWSRRHWRRC